MAPIKKSLAFQREGIENEYPPNNIDYLPFVRILNEHKVPYCMDSGVLLGLMRDGKLFDHEKDVDLQMWAEDEEQLRQLVPVFRDRGYAVTIWLYKGLIYQYRFLKEGLIPVHIMLFRRTGRWAWCPAGRGIGPPFPRKLTSRFYRYFVVVRKRLREYLTATDVTRFPWNLRRDIGTWWIPGKFFEKTAYHMEYETFIPEKWQEYLAYRYGEWQITSKKWDFWIHDGALVHLPPEKIVEFPSLEGWQEKRQLKQVRKSVREKS